MIDFALNSPRKYSLIANGEEAERTVSYMNQGTRINSSYHANNLQPPYNTYNNNNVFTIVSPSSSSDDCRNNRNSATRVEVCRKKLPKNNKKVFKHFGGKLSNAFKNLIGRRAGRDFYDEEGVIASGSCSSDIFNGEVEVRNGEISISNCVVTSLLKRDNNNIDSNLPGTEVVTQNINTTTFNNNNTNKEIPLKNSDSITIENPEIRTIETNGEPANGYEIRNSDTKLGRNNGYSKNESGADDNAYIVSEGSSGPASSLSTFSQVSIDDGFEEKIRNGAKEPDENDGNDELNMIFGDETSCDDNNNNNNIDSNNAGDSINNTNRYTDDIVITTNNTTDTNTIDNTCIDDKATYMNNVNIIDISDNNTNIHNNDNDTEESLVSKNEIENLVCSDEFKDEEGKKDEKTEVCPSQTCREYISPMGEMRAVEVTEKKETGKDILNN